MIRPFTCVCMALACASGLYLYQAKHRVQLLDRDIAATLRATEAAKARTGVLRAEWTLQNDPERLGQLADRFLSLRTVTPGQFTAMADLDKRLPPLRSAEPASAADPEDGPPAAGVPEPASPKLVSAPDPKPEPAKREVASSPPARPIPPTPPPAPVKVATVPPRAPEHHPSPAVAPSVPAAAPARVATTETRSVVAPPAAVLAPRPVSTPYPVSASYKSPSPAGPPVPVVTSVLGIARTGVAPPVPFAPQASPNNGG